MALEQVFDCPRTLRRLRTGPLGKLLEGFCPTILRVLDRQRSSKLCARTAENNPLKSRTPTLYLQLKTAASPADGGLQTFAAWFASATHLPHAAGASIQYRYTH